MDYKRRATGSPEAVASQVAAWKEAVLLDASDPRSALLDAQLDAIQLSVARYTLALSGDFIVDVIAEGHVRDETSSDCTVTMTVTKRSEAIEKAASYSGLPSYD